MRLKQFDQHALVVGVEMLHQHKGHASVRRHVVKEASKCGKATGGCADTYDQRGRPSPGDTR
jgi:hypothetical protein